MTRTRLPPRIRRRLGFSLTTGICTIGEFWCAWRIAGKYPNLTWTALVRKVASMRKRWAGGHAQFKWEGGGEEEGGVSPLRPPARLFSSGRIPKWKCPSYHTKFKMKKWRVYPPRHRLPFWGIWIARLLFRVQSQFASQCANFPTEYTPFYGDQKVLPICAAVRLDYQNNKMER